MTWAGWPLAPPLGVEEGLGRLPSWNVELGHQQQAGPQSPEPVAVSPPGASAATAQSVSLSP